MLKSLLFTDGTDIYQDINQWRPYSEEIEKCKQFGRKFGEKIKS